VPLLVILTFVTVVLIMTGALIPVLIFCGAILVTLYILVLIKNLFVSLFLNDEVGGAGVEQASVEPAEDEPRAGDASRRPETGVSDHDHTDGGPDK
jgi:hypothetical protein